MSDIEQKAKEVQEQATRKLDAYQFDVGEYEVLSRPSKPTGETDSYTKVTDTRNPDEYDTAVMFSVQPDPFDVTLEVKIRAGKSSAHNYEVSNAQQVARYVRGVMDGMFVREDKRKLEGDQ
jgi:hypothetical protein